MAKEKVCALFFVLMDELKAIHLLNLKQSTYTFLGLGLFQLCTLAGGKTKEGNSKEVKEEEEEAESSVRCCVGK